jgi:RNA polymerase sigma-70 factor (ECF subfamily)
VTRSRPEESPLAAKSVRIRTLVDEHFGFVWRYLRGLGVREADIDDAAQQVFMVAAQKIDAVREGSERAYLVSTAHGVAANARRVGVRRREVPSDDVMAEHEDESPNAEQHAQTQEELAILDRFLASLEPSLRQVFILFELEGMTMASISATLELPPGTVASKLRRAREAFQEFAKRFQAARAHETMRKQDD